MALRPVAPFSFIPRRHHNSLLFTNIYFHTKPKHSSQLKTLVNISSSVYGGSTILHLLKDDTMDKKKNKDESSARKMLEEDVRMSIINKSESEGVLQLLQFIDDIQRLGVGNYLDMEISEALCRIAGNNIRFQEMNQNLHLTSLKFRLLRKHGYQVSQDMFMSFQDDDGSFKDSLKEDVNGLLSLYEASYLAFEGETLLKEARSFAISHLKHSNLQNVDHAIEMPLHYRMLILETRWYIEAYGKKEDANKSLLQYAILNFNMVQSIIQDDLRQTSRWWENTRLANLSFIRNRLVECFFWTVGIAFEPQYNDCRKTLTKVTSLITTIDDIYDVYGTLNDLQIFTDAVKRWDVEITNTLPDDIRLCFLVLYGMIHEMAFENLRVRGINTTKILRKVWGDLCEVFLIEAKWNKSKYTPTLEEYLENGWRSVSGVVILIHSYLLMEENIRNERIDHLDTDFSDLLKWPSLIFRLCNDLGTSPDEMKRGETANAILCYMKESGSSEEEAREHIKGLIDEAWSKMNKYLVSDTISKDFIQAVMNLARISHSTYQFGDGHGAPDERSNHRVKSVVVAPITIVAFT